MLTYQLQNSFCINYLEIHNLVYSTSWKFTLNFVHNFRGDWRFLPKFGSSYPGFIRRVWHPHTWNLKFLRMNKLQLFIICKFLDMIWVWNLHWGYFLINKVGHWFYQLDHVTFSENGFWLVNFAVPFCRICYIQKSAMACLNVAIFTKKLYTL